MEEQIPPHVITESIRSGEYFKQARSWYAVKYMTVLSERFFFIVLTTMAALTMLFSALGVIGLLPIHVRVPFFYVSKDINTELPLMLGLRQTPKETENAALQRYFVKTYVQNREDYSLDKLQQQYRMIQQHSDPNAFAVYTRFIDPSNPRSPITLYQRQSLRTVTVDNVVIVPGTQPGQYNATVGYTARVHSFESDKTTRGQAQLVFTYKDLTVDQEKQDEDQSLHVQPMKFTVLEYTARELR